MMLDSFNTNFIWKVFALLLEHIYVWGGCTVDTGELLVQLHGYTTPRVLPYNSPGIATQTRWGCGQNRWRVDTTIIIYLYTNSGSLYWPWSWCEEENKILSSFPSDVSTMKYSIWFPSVPNYNPIPANVFQQKIETRVSWLVQEHNTKRCESQLGACPATAPAWQLLTFFLLCLLPLPMLHLMQPWQRWWLWQWQRGADKSNAPLDRKSVV